MRPIGANAWIWVSPLTDEGLAELAPRVREWGFDVFEFPLENPGDWDPARARAVLDEQGLGATVVAAMSPDRDLTVDDPAIVEHTRDYLRACVDHAVVIGAPTVSGPIYAPVGKTWRMSSDERRTAVANVVEGLRPVAAYAGERGVRLGLEPLNRFETSVVNTVEQAVEILDGVDSPALGLLLDTFHMNIEEQDPNAAIRAAGDRIAHVHVCANDRGAPGADHLDWPGTFAALRDAGYLGPIVIESFTSENQSIATAASIWRQLAASQDAIAIDGLAFLRTVAT